MNKTFRYLLMYHLVAGMFFEFTLTVLTPPLILLPFGALEMPGVMTSLGVPIVYQVIQLFTSIMAAVAAVCPLFYYRMDILLPPDHFLNKKIFRYSVYLFVYGICYILFAPLLYFAINYEDQTRIKKSLEIEYGITFDHLWSPFVVAMRLNDNPFTYLIAAVIILLCGAVVGLFTVCSAIIYSTIKSKTSNLSVNTKKHHIIMLKSLIASIAALGFQVVVTIPVLVYLIITHSPRADIANVFVTIGAISYPSAVVAYILSYPPYRRFNMKIYYFLRRIILQEKTKVSMMKMTKQSKKSTVF